MILDLRIPLGLMFTLTGLLLSLYGLFTNSNAELYQKSLGVNANLWWGIVLLIFGLTMYLTGRRSQIKKEMGLVSAPDHDESRPTRTH